MDGNPTEAEDACHDGADAQDVDCACGVGDVSWEDAPYDAAARYDGKHVEGEFCREARGIGEFGDEEEWDVEADEAYEGGEAEEGEGQFFEAGEVDDSFAWEWQNAQSDASAWNRESGECDEAHDSSCPTVAYYGL